MDVCKRGKQVGKAKCFLHAQYLENKANLSVKTTGHCITYLKKLYAKFGAFSTKFTFNQNTNALYPRSPSDKRSRASVMINRGDLLL